MKRFKGFLAGLLTVLLLAAGLGLWIALPWPAVLAVAWMMFIIAAFSNGANLTDGLDGLLTGAATMVFAAYVIVNIWQLNQYCGWSSAGRWGSRPGRRCRSTSPSAAPTRRRSSVPRRSSAAAHASS